MALSINIDDFEEYIRQGEPDKKEKAYIWQTAIGLQAVDGLSTSEYLKETAKRNIEGEITIDEVSRLVKSYYQSKTQREPDDDEKEENYKNKDNEDIFEKLYNEMKDELKSMKVEETKMKEKETKKEENKKEIKDELKNLKINEHKRSDDLIDFVIVDKVEDDEFENLSDKDDF